MALIPSELHGINIEFAERVDKSVTDDLLAGLDYVLSASRGIGISSIWVSSARDSHRCPSRHVTGNGIDISRLDGKRIGVHYQSNETFKALVDGLQLTFEDFVLRRENFGPGIQLKEGEPYPVDDHEHHIHWSVSGDHSACTFSFFARTWSWLAGRTSLADSDEVCNK